MTEKTLILAALTVLLIASALWALSVMGRSRVPRGDVEEPSAENNWQNEDYAEHVKADKPRSIWVSPIRYRGSKTRGRPIEW
jgi:hypothetical protein